MSEINEIANKLDGMEYPVRIPVELAKQAETAGIVIVYGASDDLMEFEGAISEEVAIYGGGEVGVSELGIVLDFEQIDKDDEDALRKYFAAEGKSRVIEAVWDDGEYSWTYKTDIPHFTFEVVEDGEKYCRGIVFKLSDAKETL